MAPALLDDQATGWWRVGVELLFRKSFWAVNLLFLAVAAFLVASTVNVFVRRKVAGAPDLGATGHRAARPMYAMPARLSLEKFAALTGIPLPKVEPAVVEPTLSQQTEDLSSAPVHTTLHVKLWGTTVSTNRLWSFAVIEDTQAHSTDSYMVDDTIQGAKVLDILDDCSKYTGAEEATDCVLILNNGHREYIDDKEGNGPMAAMIAPRPAAVAAPPPPQDSGDDGIKALGNNRYEVSRKKVNDTLGDLNKVAMQARIVPAFKNGVATGFKLFSIRPDSIYSQIGIQNGDVIRRINGFEINSPDKALEAYAKLKEANHIEIEVERNGASLTKSYDVR